MPSTAYCWAAGKGKTCFRGSPRPSGAYRRVPASRILAVAVEVGCGPAPCEPWPLCLPWRLTAVGGEPLAECCGWSFESTPPGLRTRFAPVLSPEPPLLLLIDERVPGALRHGTELTQLLERSQGCAADLYPCTDLAACRTLGPRRGGGSGTMSG